MVGAEQDNLEIMVVRVFLYQYQELVIQQFHLLEVVMVEEIQLLEVMEDLVVEVEVEIPAVAVVLVTLQVQVHHKEMMVQIDQVLQELLVEVVEELLKILELVLVVVMVHLIQ